MLFHCVLAVFFAWKGKNNSLVMYIRSLFWLSTRNQNQVSDPLSHCFTWDIIKWVFYLFLHQVAIYYVIHVHCIFIKWSFAFFTLHDISLLVSLYIRNTSKHLLFLVKISLHVFCEDRTNKWRSYHLAVCKQWYTLYINLANFYS